MDQYRTHEALGPEEGEEEEESVTSGNWRGKHNSLSEYVAVVLASLTSGGRRVLLRRFRLVPQLQARMRREIAVWLR